MVSLLISSGASLTAGDLVSFSPLHYAVWFGHDQIVQYLLSSCDAGTSSLSISITMIGCQQVTNCFIWNTHSFITSSWQRLLCWRHPAPPGGVEGSPADLHDVDGEGWRRECSRRRTSHSSTCGCSHGSHCHSHFPHPEEVSKYLPETIDNY